MTGRLGYQSAWTDQATSQVHMGARWYNPATGQFTSRDTTHLNPEPNSAAANPFAYAAGNPLTGTDPTGHMLEHDASGGCAGTDAQCAAIDRHITAIVSTYHPAAPPRPATILGGLIAANASHRTSASYTPPGLPATGHDPSTPTHINDVPPATVLGGLLAANARQRTSSVAWPGSGYSSSTPTHINDVPPATVLGGLLAANARQRTPGHETGAAWPGSGYLSGGFNPFSWIGHEVSVHYRGLTEFGIGVLAAAGAAACIATVVCAAAGATIGLSAGASMLAGSAIIGAAAGVATYSLQSGPHTLRGYLVHAVLGGAVGAVGAGWTLAATGAGISAVMTGIGGMALGAQANLVQYDMNVASAYRTPMGVLSAEMIGALGAFPIDDSFFGQSNSEVEDGKGE